MSQNISSDRLQSIASHITGARPKVVITRNLGPDVMPLLQTRKDIDVGGFI